MPWLNLPDALGKRAKRFHGLLGGSALVPTYGPETHAAAYAYLRTFYGEGDSRSFGVGVQNSGLAHDNSYIGQLITKFLSGAFTHNDHGGDNSAMVLAKFNTLIAGTPAAKAAMHVTFCDLNDYGTNQAPTPFDRNWPGSVITNVSAIRTQQTSADALDRLHFCGVHEDSASTGMRHHADHLYEYQLLLSTYDPRTVMELGQYMKGKVTVNGADIDAKLVSFYGQLPLSMRGHDNAVEVPYTANPGTTTFSSATTSPYASAQAAVFAALGNAWAEGTIAQNTNSAAASVAFMWRKVGASGVGISSTAWEQCSDKHGSIYGYGQPAQAVFDREAARDGHGPAFCCPSRFLPCQKDCPAGTVIGSIPIIGTSTATSLWDLSGVAITTFSLVLNGNQLDVTRTAVGTLTEGELPLRVQTEDGTHKLFSEHMAYVGEASTQTVPRMWTIPGAGTSPGGDFTMSPRENHGWTGASGKFGMACWINVGASTDNCYLVNAQDRLSPGSNTQLQIYITPSNTIRILGYDTGHNLIYNINSNTLITRGLPYWIALQFDTTGAAPSVVGYLNKGGVGSDTLIDLGSPAAITKTVDFTTDYLLFWANRDANAGTFANSAPDLVRGQFVGKFGNLILWDGDIGVAGAGKAALWTPATGAPVARAPHSAINGVSAIPVDIRGGPGNLAGGGYLPTTRPISATRHIINGLT